MHSTGPYTRTQGGRTTNRLREWPLGALGADVRLLVAGCSGDAKLVGLVPVGVPIGALRCSVILPDGRTANDNVNLGVAVRGVRSGLGPKDLLAN